MPLRPVAPSTRISALAALILGATLATTQTSCNWRRDKPDEPDSGLNDGDGGADDGLDGSNCNDDLCIEIYDAMYTIQECDGAPEEICSYANVFFLLTDDGANVRDLSLDDLTMTLNDREVGVEGAEALTQENGMVVSLLLDRSYSITESGSTTAVKEAATEFVSNLPAEAWVSVSMFASEEKVPLLLTEGEEPSTTSGTIYQVGEQLRSVKQLITQQYEPYESATSSSFTKLYDAVAGLSVFVPTSDTLKLMPSVMIVFTDGADTASTEQLTAGDLRRYLDDTRPDQKIYAVGLGSNIDEAALDTISYSRSYLATSEDGLQSVFEEVSADLSAIYQYRILVASTEPNASARLTIDYHGSQLTVGQTMYEVDVSGGGGGGGDGGSDDGGDPPDTGR